MSGEYNETSFPSKILTYFSVGLNVVTCNIKVLKISELEKILNFYNEDDPQSIARKIGDITLIRKGEIINELYHLEKQFKKDLEVILNN